MSGSSADRRGGEITDSDWCNEGGAEVAKSLGVVARTRGRVETR